MSGPEETLDPADWESMRRLSHRIIDEALDYTRDVRTRPVWKAMPDDVQNTFTAPLPQNPSPLEDVYGALSQNIMEYPMGNIHPRFWMWYMGSSNFTGALGDFLAAVQGSNLGGGNHAACLVDQQVVNWCKEMLGFPASSSGTLVSGGSMANLIGLTVARNQKAGVEVRQLGLGAMDRPLCFYGSDQIHGCHEIAVETLGMGNRSLRKVRSNPDCTIDIDALKAAIDKDRADGHNPACVIANAGTVNTGAIDDLNAIHALCKEQGMWFHVDGCIGALMTIAPENRHRVVGIEHADSIALDPHKWLHAPFEVGCALIRDSDAHLAAFSQTPEYLETAKRGVAASDWLYHYGMQTSRGFRALKVWMSLQEHGVQKFGRLIDQNIKQAQYLSNLIESDEHLILTVPTNINIVCYRFEVDGIPEGTSKEINTEIMLQLQETGVAAISDTTVHGRHCLRVAINNHRTITSDLEVLVTETVRLGKEIAKEYL